MVFLMKLQHLDRDLLDFHKNNIINEELEFKHEPVVLYGDEACNFLRENVSAFHNKSNKKILSKTGGYFHYENIPDDYKKTGVVCIMNGKIGTLAHELRHAKQFQDDDKWMKLEKWNKFFYKYAYSFYPTEREAFRFAAEYLIKYKLYKLAFLYILKIISATVGNRFLWPIHLILIIKFFIFYVQWLTKLVN